jgi:hypothetical protein
MAAGLGFKDFQTGEVLTAADVDGYLMQGVWVFADAAARTAAVTSPQEGNISFLKDTNSTEYYSGSAWTSIAPASASGLTFITSTTFTDSTGANIDNIFSTSYENYLIIGDDITSVGGGAYLGMQFRYGSTTLTACNGVQFGYNVANSLETNGQNNTAAFVISRNHNSGFSSFNLFISQVGNTSEKAMIRGNFSAQEGSQSGVIGGFTHTAETFTGLRFLPHPTVGSGSNVSGRITVYGLAKS